MPATANRLCSGDGARCRVSLGKPQQTEISGQFWFGTFLVAGCGRGQLILDFLRREFFGPRACFVSYLRATPLPLSLVWMCKMQIEVGECEC